MLFDWLVTGQVMPSNSAHAVHGPRHSVIKGATGVISSAEARQLLDSMDTSTLVGLRDRAIVATMAFTFARVSAVIGLKVEDYYAQKKRWWLRLREKTARSMRCPAITSWKAILMRTSRPPALPPIGRGRCSAPRSGARGGYLTNGGRIKVAQRMAGHSNAKTTGLYDRRNDDISVSEVERVGI